MFKRVGACVCGCTWYILALVLIFRHFYLLHIETFTFESHGSAGSLYIIQPFQPPSILYQDKLGRKDEISDFQRFSDPLLILCSPYKLDNVLDDF